MFLESILQNGTLADKSVREQTTNRNKNDHGHSSYNKFLKMCIDIVKYVL